MIRMACLAFFVHAALLQAAELIAKVPVKAHGLPDHKQHIP